MVFAKRGGWLFILAILALSSYAAGEPLRIPERPSQRPQLKTIYCSIKSLQHFVDDQTQALVLVFLGVDCPVAQQYLPRLKTLHEQYADQGVEFLGIFPNGRVHVMRMAQFAHHHDLPFPVLLDVEHRLADLLEVSVTPEVVVLDRDMNLLYQGAIDNQFTKRGAIQEPTKRFLCSALDNLLAGTTLPISYEAPSGCPVERLDATPPTETQLTYYRDVAPIIQSHCQGCHRPGGVGPFELLAYEDAYYSAERIQEVVHERRMPPWHGFLNPKFGTLTNDISLSDEQIAIISKWVEQGAPAGDPNEAPVPIEWPQPEAWQIGQPDYVYRIPEPFHVPKHGVLEYQYFRVRLDLPEDRWIRAVEVKPGNAEVVHHIGLHVVQSDDRVYSGFAGMAALYGFTTEGAQLINDYVPGDSYNAKVYPAGQAVRIPKNSDLIFEIHYTPNNREATTDQSMVAFQWADEPPDDEVLTQVFRKPIGRFRIPPHDPHFVMNDSYYFKHDVLIDAIRPHFHYRGKSFRLEMVQRDPKSDEIVNRETVLTVPIFDPDWQRTYELATPLFVPAGMELLATGHFDNSNLNPNNPDPSTEVLWGQQTSDEMFSTRFKFRRAQ